jgi:putative transcriptional regulator
MPGKPLNRIKEVLKEKGRSQVWLADELAVTVVTLSRWINGHRQITLVDLQRIAKLLKVPGKDLINF